MSETRAEALRIEAGKTYVNGRGDTCGPMEERTPGVWLDQYGAVYHLDGKEWNHIEGSTANLVHETKAEAKVGLVKNLRRIAQSNARNINAPAIGSDPSHYLEGQAADEIERLAERVRVLEGALRPFASVIFNDNGDVTYDYSHVSKDDYWRAYQLLRRAALATATPGKGE